MTDFLEWAGRIFVFISVLALTIMFFYSVFAHAQTEEKEIEVTAKPVILYNFTSKAFPVYETIIDRVYYDCASNITSQTVINGCSYLKFTESVKSYYYVNISIGKPVVSLNGKTSVWKYPVGDRNMQEFGTCRDFEKEKGVCIEQ